MLTGKFTENIKLPMFTDWWSSLEISVLHFHTWVTDKLKALIKTISVYKSCSGNLIKFAFNPLCLDSWAQSKAEEYTKSMTQLFTGIYVFGGI